MSTAWAWVKKNWKWLLFPIGILLFVIGKVSAKKSYRVINPELVDAEKTKRKAREESEAKNLEAKKERDKRLAEVVEAHDTKLQNLTAEQNEKVDELRDDPERLNEYLLEVGKDIRG